MNSLTAQTYSNLRREILAGRFGPGLRLRPAHLASERGVGLNAVREALSRLAGEGLVQVAPQHGFRVIAFSVEDIVDVTRVRALVETAALRQSIEKGDLNWETAVVAAHHRLANTPMTTGSPSELNPDWVQAHSEFHAATMAACGSPRLIEITSDLATSMAIVIYRHWAELYVGSQVRQDAASEHRAIFEAILARDADLACRLNAEHNQGATDIIVAVLNKSSEPAPEGDAVLEAAGD